MVVIINLLYSLKRHLESCVCKEHSQRALPLLPYFGGVKGWQPKSFSSLPSACRVACITGPSYSASRRSGAAPWLVTPEEGGEQPASRTLGTPSRSLWLGCETVGAEPRQECKHPQNPAEVSGPGSRMQSEYWFLPLLPKAASASWAGAQPGRGFQCRPYASQPPTLSLAPRALDVCSL